MCVRVSECVIGSVLLGWKLVIRCQCCRGQYQRYGLYCSRDAVSLSLSALLLTNVYTAGNNIK